MNATPVPPSPSPQGDPSPLDAQRLAEQGKKAAAKAWEWTKKAAAFAWPRIRKGAKVVAEKVDGEMDRIVESINQPPRTPHAAPQAPTAPSAPPSPEQGAEKPQA